MSKYAFEFIKEEDVEFIYLLRSLTKSNFLSQGDRKENIEFFRNYFKNDENTYMKYVSKDEVVGCYRYQNVDNQIEIGSWVTNPESKALLKVHMDIEFKKLVFRQTKAKIIFFKVNKKKLSVQRHHENYGALKFLEVGDSIKYSLKEATFEKKIK